MTESAVGVAATDAILMALAAVTSMYDGYSVLHPGSDWAGNTNCLYASEGIEKLATASTATVASGVVALTSAAAAVSGLLTSLGLPLPGNSLPGYPTG